MGRNLALNLRDRGHRVAVHDAAPAALEQIPITQDHSLRR
jgi:6-phosphogluconate dehydrogenase